MADAFTPEEIRKGRRKLIGDRAKFLLKCGYLSKSDLVWLSKLVADEDTNLLSVEYLLQASESAADGVRIAQADQGSSDAKSDEKAGEGG